VRNSTVTGRRFRSPLPFEGSGREPPAVRGSPSLRSSRSVSVQYRLDGWLPTSSQVRTGLDGMVSRKDPFILFSYEPLHRAGYEQVGTDPSPSVTPPRALRSEREPFKGWDFGHGDRPPDL
jgi:hypothetical protein